LLVVVIIVCYALSYKVAPIVLSGKHVIITGGSSGIGLSLSVKLVKKGCSVTIFARDEQKLKSAGVQLEKYRTDKDQKIGYFVVDVSDYKAVESAVQKSALNNNNHIDILICSAGVTKPERFHEADLSAIPWLMNINYLGSVYCTHAVIPYMKPQKSGRIVYVSSLLGLMGFPGYAGYSATKFALKGFAESLDVELAPWNIHFSISCPGNVDTPMFEEEEKIKPAETKLLEEGKPISPDVVADRIIESFHSWRFLIYSDMNSFFLSSLSGGFAPANFTESLCQFFLSPILRIVSLMERKKYRDTIIKYNQK